MQKELRSAIEHIQATKSTSKSKRLKFAREILEEILEKYGLDREELSALSRSIGSEMKGFFNLGEACAIIDNLNGVYLLPAPGHRYEAGGIAHNIYDGCSLEGLDEKWKINRDNLVRKIESMPPHRIWWMTRQVIKFWGENKTEFSKETIKTLFLCSDD